MNNVIGYYSICCNAPPLYEVSDRKCMSCRKETTFDWVVGKEEVCDE